MVELREQRTGCQLTLLNLEPVTRWGGTLVAGEAARRLTGSNVKLPGISGDDGIAALAPATDWSLGKARSKH